MSYGDYPNLDAVERVLVVKLRHHGDVLLASPVFRVLRRALPEARIDAYIYREMLPMLEGHPETGCPSPCNREVAGQRVCVHPRS